MAQDELLSLFPTPVLIAQYPVPYEKELEYIRNLPCRRENKGGDAGNKIHYNDNLKILLYWINQNFLISGSLSSPRSISLHEKSCALKMSW